MMGIRKKKPSNRSSNPPWPGMMLPESFTPVYRFKEDSNRSPSVPKIPAAAPYIIQTVMASSTILEITAPITMAKASPPKNPSQVLFGDTFGANLFLPNLDPAKYAPMSFAQIKNSNPRHGPKS